MLRWKKIGQVFDPTKDSEQNWMSEYAQIPFPYVLNSSVIRVYFATRPSRDSDLQYISRSGFVDFDRNNLTYIKRVSEQPIFDLGGAGSFDEFGAMTSSFVKVEDQVYAYYTGWSRLETVPYTMANGMAISHDQGVSFRKISEGPIMGATIHEPFLLSGPIVKRIDGDWHMWYLNGLRWLMHDGKYEPVYKLAYAKSQNGIDWHRNGEPVIPSKFKDECQVGFALFHKFGKWNVIFAYRQPTDFRTGGSGSYRLGYAWSTDLKTWNRNDDEVGISVSDEGWDSEMMAYPQVCEFDNRVILFYCGNQFGKYGFGIAELIG